MSVSFVRVDDRMIHGQTCTRWALEYPCDGLVAVNDSRRLTKALPGKRPLCGPWKSGRRNARRF